MGVNPSILVDSLGWALLHSVWQIALIALLVAAALRIIPRHNAQLRFVTAYGGLASTLLLFAVTWVLTYRTIAAVEPVATAYVAPAYGWDAVVKTLGQTTMFISTLWALGFSWLGIRYFQALRATMRLKQEGTGPVPVDWEMRFRLWVERLGADASATILQSSRITTPLTIGVLKPVVLVPTGFFLRLPIDQAEAVLVHEIAHICRQDYLLGLIQAMICNIFFFHPAIAYLSRQIDIEREYACDARVVAETGDSNALAQGLSKVALESRDMLPGFAMAADGRRTPLMNRISRLRERPFRRENGTATPVAALTLVLAGCLTIAASADASFSSGKADDADEKGATQETETLTAAADPGATEQSEKTDREIREERAEPAESRRSSEPPKRERHRGDRSASTDQSTWETETSRSWNFSFDGNQNAGSKGLERAFQPTSIQLDSSFIEDALIHAAIFETDSVAVAEDRDADCEDKQETATERRERSHERRERQRERAYERREREIARMEAQAEREVAQVEREMAQVERTIEREMARVEREMARAEREFERAGHTQSAAFNREMERLSMRMSALGSELQTRLDGHRERIEQRVERMERDLRRQRSVTPPAPPEPPAPTITISFQIENMGNDASQGASASALRVATATTG